jgi:hypothetical protein
LRHLFETEGVSIVYLSMNFVTNATMANLNLY